jgi:hypothetical protein
MTIYQGYAEIEVSPEKGLVVTKPKRKRPSGSPTQRSLAHMRELGYVCAVVEKWNPHAKVRQDLYGFIDVLCVKDEDIVGVQACSSSGGDVAERVRKITEHDNWPLVCKAIRVVVHGWRKNAAGRWTLREVEL